MIKNEIYRLNEDIIRILAVEGENCLCIDCSGKAMPTWKPVEEFSGYSLVSDEYLYALKGFEVVDADDISPERNRIMHKRYSLISPILPFIGDKKTRDRVIAGITHEEKISAQTIRSYLKSYLIFSHIQVFLPKERKKRTELTNDEKNMRRALNKYYYTFDKNSLRSAYTKMLKEKYCDETGQLLEKYPTFNQFRYYYRKTKSAQNQLISRSGLSNYQRNYRPLLGDNVRAYAATPGLGMVDATVCDIYLVNGSGQVVGRPILTACVDAYSGICMGFSVGWEGGIYSVRDLCLNMIENKVELCKKNGIKIQLCDWPVHQLPSRIMSDRGSEYIGNNFEQIVELGITLINLPGYRADLKGEIEKFFDQIQSLYKKELKGKGIIEPDFQDRGAHDYRKDACITIETFERILIRCIIFYNSKRVLKSYPFTEDMINKGIKPYSNAIWDYGLSLPGANLIDVDKERLTLCLLPRTKGSFKRNGLIVNKLRYGNKAFKERYLTGGDAVVAYDPDSTNYVWLIKRNEYFRFSIIESRFKDKSLEKVKVESKQAKEIVKAEEENNLQAEIDLSNQIQNIVNANKIESDNSTKHIKETRKNEIKKTHKSHVEEAGLND